MCSKGRFGHAFCIRPSQFSFDLCHSLAGEAERHGLAPGFLTRLIWQESRFDPNALSPANAMGIAQFIASTAALRGLQDPFNPGEALEASARYLAFLTQEFGNPGLAAAAYNAGEGRAARFLSRQSGLPQETINYVQIITGLSAETWRDTPPKSADFRLGKEKPFIAACLDLAKRRRITPLAPIPPALKPWGVHLAFGTSKSTARAALQRNTRTCRSTVRNETIDYIRDARRTSNRKRYTIARIGRNSRENATQLCLKLSRSGCRCRVYKTAKSP
ncbi:MAG: lytic transglycosylase domain-containing protein [Aliishimia sp.]